MDLMLFWQISLYWLAGICAGLLSGILGIGGGVVVVPALLWIFTGNPAIPPEIAMQVATGSSLAIMAFTSAAAVHAHHKIETLPWAHCASIGVWLALGAGTGALLAMYLPTTLLKKLFAIFLVGVAFRMRHAVTFSNTTPPPVWLNIAIICLIGVNSGLLGVGGGILIIPYLTYCGIPLRQVLPTTALCTCLVACVGSVVFMSIVPDDAALSAYMTGYIYWPAVAGVAMASMLCAPIGAQWSHRLPTRFIHRLFLGVLIITAGGLWL